MAESFGRTSWIPIIFTSLVFGMEVYFITKLNLMYKGRVLYEYGPKIVGKYLSVAICFYYMLYFIVIGLFFKFNFVGLLKNNFLPKTPDIVILIVGIPIFGYIAYKGITNIARMFEIIGIISLIIVVILCIFMVVQGMAENILPIFYLDDLKNFIPKTGKLLTPFGGIEILFIIPLISINKKIPKKSFYNILIIGLYYVLIVESSIMIIGINNAISYNDAFIQSTKLVQLPVIERTDIFYFTIGLTSLFAGMIIVFAGVLEYACKIFKNVKRYVLDIIICVIFFVLFILSSFIKNASDILESLTTNLVIISSLAIPTFLYIIAKLKKTFNK
jgi:spore germination protein (amino acid permease)